MTALAYGVHDKLIKQGIDPRSDEYYEKIDSRLKQIFPDRFNDHEEDIPQEEVKVSPEEVKCCRSCKAKSIF